MKWIRQADMWDPAASSLTHDADTKEALFRQATAFRGQVLLVNGDSHHFVVDQNHWTSITVDRSDPNLFAVHQHVVAGNVPQYTPPAG